MPIRARSLKSSVSGIVVMSSPKTRMVPESALRSPSASFISTDFPPPAGPRMMRVSPCVTENEIFSRTGLRSKAIETFSKTTTGSFSAGRLCVGSSRVRTSAMALPLPAKDAYHRTTDEKVHDDDGDGGDDDSLRRCTAHALGSTLGGHAEVAAH